MMMRWPKQVRGAAAALTAAAALLLASPAAAGAQCIMCYMSATASGERGAHVLRLGIIVLAVPTLLTFAGIFLLAYRRRHPVERPKPAAENNAGAGILPLSADEQSGFPSVL